MTTTDGCHLCALAAGSGPDQGWVLHDELVSAYTNGSNIPGWIQLQVNRHAPHLGELTEREGAAIAAASSAIAREVVAITRASRVYAFSMCEFVPHFHLVLGPAPEVPESVPRGAPLLSRIMTRDAELQDPERAAAIGKLLHSALSP